jgi:putative sterol carrier protein
MKMAIPLPPPVSNETMRDILAGMAIVFNPAALDTPAGAAQEFEGVIQFQVTGGEPGNYYLQIAKRTCAAFDGVHPAPTLTINTPSEVWLAISRGEMSGVEGFLNKKYQIEGDMGLLMRFEQLFPANAAADSIQAAPAPVYQAPAPEETVQRGPLKLGMHWLTVAFIPWMAHWIMNDIPHISAWTSVGIPLILGIIVWAYRRTFGQDTWMDTGTPLYLGFLGFTTLLGIDFFRTNSDIVGNMVISGIWMGTLATSIPLTLNYSKWSYPPALWREQIFVRTNAILTAFWGITFSLMAVLALIGHQNPEHRLLWVIIRNLLLLPAFAFTAWFQKWYPIRMSYRK